MSIPTREEWLRALVERHGARRQQAFSSATVAVCLILIDFDKVDITNLHRQQYKA